MIELKIFGSTTTNTASSKAFFSYRQELNAAFLLPLSVIFRIIRFPHVATAGIGPTSCTL